jgi:uncharacterized protein YbjT (DUF2867 family)
MIVVTGATGNVGRPLVEALVAAGEQVTAVSRRLSTGDLADPESLRPVLAGADALFLLIAGGGENMRPRDIVDVAKGSGVSRIVLLSSQVAGTRPEASSHAHLREFEDAVQQSGVDWTILRPAGFASNAFAWAQTISAERMVAAPFGDVGLPDIDPADIASVAAEALRDKAHAGRVYELTGPELISPRQRTQAIADALGEPVRFVAVTRAEARTQMLQFMPEPVVDGTLDILGEPLAVEQRVSPDVERVLGRPPHTFAQWAARNLAAFRLASGPVDRPS